MERLKHVAEFEDNYEAEVIPCDELVVFSGSEGAVVSFTYKEFEEIIKFYKKWKENK